MYNSYPQGFIPDSAAMQRYMELMQLYDGAVREVRTKLEILDREFQVRYARNPIHHIESRLKSPNSIAEKLRRKGLPETIDAAEQNLLDIAGVRILCNYVQDIYHVADLLTRQRDIEVVHKKDYIADPKGNGYRSLHLVVRIPVFLSSHTELVPVEIQIRTIAMDFWASLEHELHYKNEHDANEALKLRLKLCAETSAALDEEMQSIYQEIHGSQYAYAEKKVAQHTEAMLQSFQNNF